MGDFFKPEFQTAFGCTTPCRLSFINECFCHKTRLIGPWPAVLTKSIAIQNWLWVHMHLIHKFQHVMVRFRKSTRFWRFSSNMITAALFCGHSAYNWDIQKRGDIAFSNCMLNNRNRFVYEALGQFWPWQPAGLSQGRGVHGRIWYEVYRDTLYCSFYSEIIHVHRVKCLRHAYIHRF